MSNYVVIVPVREFENSKIRLRSVMSDEQRASLTASLLHRVLSQVEKSRALQVVIVASRPDQAGKYHSDFSKARIVGETRHHGGVNSAMLDGLKNIGTEFSRASILLIPSDLPLLTFRALDHVGRLLEKYDLLINPSSKLDGTNLVAFDPERGLIPLHYDDDSFRNHCAEAKTLKIKHRILRMKEFSFDVDSYQDLQRLEKVLGASSFEELIAKLKNGART
ncbi:MAG: 2-phospho-L-lactate guanylyltransferase [Nitrososphaerales archaeon]